MGGRLRASRSGLGDATTSVRRGVSTRRLMVVIAGVGCLLAAVEWAIQRSEAWWGLFDAFELAAYFFPRLAWAAGGGGMLALVPAVIDRRIWRIRFLWLLLPLIVPIGILTFGMAFRYDGAPPDVIARRLQWVGWLVWIHLPLGMALLAGFRSASTWIIVAGLTVAAVWLSLGASILGAMSITNQWI